MKSNFSPATVAFRFLIVSLGLLAATAQFANAGTQYQCDLDAQRAKGWVSHKMLIVIEDKGHAIVVDDAIRKFVGKSMAAKNIQIGNTARVTWNIANVTDEKGKRSPTMRYVAKLNTKTRKITVTASPLGYQQSFSAKGSCKAHKK